MSFRLVANITPPVLECVAPIATVDDALNIVSAAHEYGTHRLLLDEAQLPESFFDLKTRFAGEFVQKLINYRITTAAVFRAKEPYSGRFREYIDEARNGRQFRVFTVETEALQWLVDHA